MHESDGSYEHILPHQARIRGLTYQTEVYAAVEIKKIKLGDENLKTRIRPIISEESLFQDDKVQIGKIPVMVRSKFCHLSNLTKS
jgi:DNA-directed RNA polymerase II subunit RPB2